MLVNRDLVNLKTVLDQADVVLEVLDARDPQAFRSSHLEKLAASKPGQRTLLVLNKIGKFTVYFSCNMFGLIKYYRRCLPTGGGGFLGSPTAQRASNFSVSIGRCVPTRWTRAHHKTEGQG